MKYSEISANSYSFVGDAYHSLAVRMHLVKLGFQQPKTLQKHSLHFVSAKSQYEIFNYLKELEIFSQTELEIYKKGRNAINHIPKNGDLITYSVASGFEAIIGYLYIFDQPRLETIYQHIFAWRTIEC